MRLKLDSSVVGSSATLLVVAGIIDWSTIAQFRAALARFVSRPQPAILVDFTGLLSWSPEAQAVLARATGQARLQGGRLVVFGLASIPAWQAGGCDLRDLDRALHVASDNGAALAQDADARPEVKRPPAEPEPPASVGERRLKPERRRADMDDGGLDAAARFLGRQRGFAGNRHALRLAGSTRPR